MINSERCNNLPNTFFESMKNYDFSILSPYEFECLSRDLLRKRDGLDYSNFAEGRDGGIDLRASLANGRTVIVQAKRYKSYSQLKSVLAKEVYKVARLKPVRYIITTSVDLTADNISVIKKMFHPYIKSDNDILGKQDLNKLLGDFKDIEYKYYKLWLSSSDVMQAFLKKRIVNDSRFAMEDIQECVRTYVMNPSFNKALDILKENKYVIISGMPGIGKTSLAQMLVYFLLSTKGGKYEQFYFIPSYLDDFSEVFQDGVKQVFFFDDFLGDTRFDKQENNFDAKLLSRINAVQRHPDKLFILTTREYILNDAKKYYPKLETSGIEIAKCIVDVGEYSKWVKGQILYNHLDASGMDEEYLKAILRNKNYMKLIEHKNFNPRIIETFVKQARLETCSPDLYFDKILKFFDNPESVWAAAFRQLQLHAREMMFVLASMAPPVMYDTWREAYRYFYDSVYQKQGYLDEQEWDDHVKTLMNSFIIIKDGPDGRFVDYVNPGIKDFIIAYISNEETIQKRLLEHSYYVDQLCSIFQEGSHSFVEIRVPDKFSSLVLENFERIWADFRSCKVLRVRNEELGSYCSPYPMSKIEAVDKFLDSYRQFVQKQPDFIEQKLTRNILCDQRNVYFGLCTIEHIDLSKLSVDEEVIFSFYRNNLTGLYRFEKFIKLLDTKFLSHQDCKNEQTFLEEFNATFLSEILRKDADYNALESEMQDFQELLPCWDSTEVSETINEKRNETDEYIDSMIDSMVDDYEFYRENEKIDEDAQIENLFSTFNT